MASRYITESDGSFLHQRSREFDPEVWDTQERMDRVAVAYDPETFTLFKVGSEEMVDRWVAKVNRTGTIPVAKAVFLKGFPVDTINCLLTTSGYLRKVIEELPT